VRLRYRGLFRANAVSLGPTFIAHILTMARLATEQADLSVAARKGNERHHWRASPRSSPDQGFRVPRFWNNEVLNAGGGRDSIVAASW
jgi:hypothetical protein